MTLENTRPDGDLQTTPKTTWETPELVTMSVAAVTQGDPTISDDGLGDGLFSN